MVALVIVVPTLDGGEALRVRGGDVMSVSFGTSWICGDDCTLSFATLFNLKDSDPFIDFGEVVVKSETETRVLFHDDVLNTAIPTWHSFVTGLSPGHWDFSVVNANGLDTSTTSEMYLDKFSVMGVVAPAPVPIPATTVFLLPGLAMLAKFRRRRM